MAVPTSGDSGPPVPTNPSQVLPLVRTERQVRVVRRLPSKRQSETLTDVLEVPLKSGVKLFGSKSITTPPLVCLVSEVRVLR